MSFTVAILAAGASAADSAPVWVWYRHSEGCPNGDVFVQRLAELGKDAKLSRVGDPVDFVVTLEGGSGSSAGSLERQTSGGTVAIREYHDSDCQQVSEALALTLALALGSDAPPSEVSEAPRALGPPPDVTAHESLILEAPASARELSPAVRAPFTDAPALLSVGIQASMASGISPSLMVGAAPFFESRDSDWIVDRLRAALFVAYGEAGARSGEVVTSLLAARLEACPVSWGAPAFSVGPCLGAEVGALRAKGTGSFGTSDTGAWGSAAAHGRFESWLTPGLALEAQIGLRVPFVRYSVGTRDGTGTWYRSQAVSPEAALGIAVRIP